MTLTNRGVRQLSAAILRCAIRDAMGWTPRRDGDYHLSDANNEVRMNRARRWIKGNGNFFQGLAWGVNLDPERITDLIDGRLGGDDALMKQDSFDIAELFTCKECV